MPPLEFPNKKKYIGCGQKFTGKSSSCLKTKRALVHQLHAVVFINVGSSVSLGFILLGRNYFLFESKIFLFLKLTVMLI